MKCLAPRSVLLVLLATLWACSAAAVEKIPLPEHPRPDFERPEWLNLNGRWDFALDAKEEGIGGNWAKRDWGETGTILVPFSWASPLSGVKGQADIGWYHRSVSIPETWRGKRVFLVVGASDWSTQGWLNGELLGEHRGGYTPFEFELTPHIRWGGAQSVVLRVDDAPRAFRLEGKQGYGDAKGIWQTVYLEARPAVFLRSVHFTPDIDAGKVSVRARLSDDAPPGTRLILRFKDESIQPVETQVPARARDVAFEVKLAHPHLWSLDDPYLYDVTTELVQDGSSDRVASYFGMRKISVQKLPGIDFPYVALNGKPVYLQLTLDQSYHPDGYYTFPTDEFMRDEILRSKRIGLNGNRVHIKVELPRKLYWADRLGLLMMADVPNFWGDPTPPARQESEYALREMIQRDFNHPSIFSWVVFNETWGLFTKAADGSKTYLPETQEWVARMYRLAKQLDPTRLVEDNSPCNHDHVETDLNSWHEYLPGYAWREKLDQITNDTFPGSKWNFIGDRVQGEQPMFNSECGNVWGYEGSTGDVDWSWDYHVMMNEFRRHPKVAGWLYTEHHDVINEWNGYYRFDRSEKDAGLQSLVPEMSLRDLHGPYYLSTGTELCRDVKPGENVEVPIFASFLTDQRADETLVLRSQLYGWNSLGQREEYAQAVRMVPFTPWMAKELEPLKVTMPSNPALVVLALTLENRAGAVVHRNFCTFNVKRGELPRDESLKLASGSRRILRFAPSTFHEAKWSLKQWDVLDGLKVNGAGAGFFEYRLPWPANLDAKAIAGATLVFEASAKQLFGKDRGKTSDENADYMRGEGSHDSSANPNAYPMTDTAPTPSQVRVRLNGMSAGVYPLPDDPADHRGILSWHAQLRDKKLREAGSYGYLIQAILPAVALDRAAAAKELVIRFEVDAAFPGGLALYGEHFGRYPLDPTLILELK
jgi:Glycosyl hydrolases family 2, sugar binding domain/Glycosyl hydrolases family 2/Glycosyl hydrolases family 2, TIM barrel domain